MEKKDVADYGLPPRETMILEEYREKHATFEKLLQVVKNILSESIASNSIYINALEARIKAEDSLAGKLERKAGKYSSLSDLTDILSASSRSTATRSTRLQLSWERFSRSTGKTASTSARCTTSTASATARSITYAVFQGRSLKIPHTPS